MDPSSILGGSTVEPTTFYGCGFFILYKSSLKYFELKSYTAGDTDLPDNFDEIGNLVKKTFFENSKVTYTEEYKYEYYTT